MAVTKKTFPNQDIIDQLNDAVDNPMSERISTKYYEPYKIKSLMESTRENLFFLNLNIPSLCFHIEELTTYI